MRVAKKATAMKMGTRKIRLRLLLLEYTIHTPLDESSDEAYIHRVTFRVTSPQCIQRVKEEK